MAGTIIVSSIKTDTDNSFIVRSNTGATLFSVDTTSISIPDGSITSAMIANGTVIAADVADGSITDAKIAAVANTKITGLVTAAQIANVANTQITGNITSSQIAANAVTQTAIATGVVGTGPAFRAYRNTNQTISAATATKIAFNAENFDTNNNFDSTTNYRFTPTVAGYYQINANAGFTTGSGQLNIYKNGSNYQTGVEVTYNASLGGHFSINDLVYLNGSTDYIEIYTYLTTGTTITSGDTNTAFSASMVRSA